MTEHDPSLEETRVPSYDPESPAFVRRVTSLAKTAVSQYKPKNLNPDLDRDDLEQTAAAAILAESRRAFEAGKVTDARILLGQAKKKIHREVEKSNQTPHGTHEPLPPAKTSDLSQKTLLGELLDALEPSERKAIEWRYGLTGPEVSVWEISDRLGISQASAYRLIDRAVTKMAKIGKAREKQTEDSR